MNVNQANEAIKFLGFDDSSLTTKWIYFSNVFEKQEEGNYVLTGSAMAEVQSVLKCRVYPVTTEEIVEWCADIFSTYNEYSDPVGYPIYSVISNSPQEAVTDLLLQYMNNS